MKKSNKRKKSNEDEDPKYNVYTYEVVRVPCRNPDLETENQIAFSRKWGNEADKEYEYHRSDSKPVENVPAPAKFTFDHKEYSHYKDWLSSDKRIKLVSVKNKPPIAKEAKRFGGD